MGGLFSFLFGRREPQTPIKGFGVRITNLLKTNYRGVFGVLVPLIVLILIYDPVNRYKSLGAVWFCMAWFVLLQPVAVNVAGFIPIFALPMFGIMTSDQTIECYFNEHIVLFFIAGWLLMTLNCCGLDKRIACYFLCAGGDTGYSATKILLKSMVTAFILSMLCNRILAVEAMLDIILPPLQTLSSYTRAEADYKQFIAILCNAIAISAAIGSMCVIHASLTTLQLKAMFAEVAGAGKEFPDIFNYLQFSAYAVPTAIGMLLLNVIYHIALIKLVVEKNKPMSKVSMTSVKTAYTKSQNSLGEKTPHETASSVLLTLSFVCFYTRWSAWLSMGWSTFRREVTSPEIPGKLGVPSTPFTMSWRQELCLFVIYIISISSFINFVMVKDATTASIFTFIFHLLPKTLGFIKIFTVEKEKDAPLKMESGILFWKYVDKNTDYSYFYIMGGAIALYKASVSTGLTAKITEQIGGHITGLGWNIGILVVVMVSAFLGNVISGCGAQAVAMPLFVAIASNAGNPWPPRLYLVVLGVGLATGFGFTIPFRDTTCCYTNSKGKVQRWTQVKYAILSVLICSLVLYVTLTFYAPLLWDPNGTGVIQVQAPASGEASTEAATTEAAPE